MMNNIPKETRVENNVNSFLFLIMFCGFTFMIWLVQFHWKMRRLYAFSLKLPGPLSIPVLGCAWKFIGANEESFTKLMREADCYADTYRMWFGYELFINVGKPEQLEIILNSPKCLQKSRVYEFASAVVGTGIMTAPVHIWKKNRKLINPAFNQKILDGFVQIFVEQSKILVDIVMKNNVEKDLDIFSLISACTLDSVCEAVMGIKVDAQTRSCGYEKWLDKALNAVFQRSCRIWYHPSWIFSFSKLSRTLNENTSRMHEFTKNVITEKRKLFDQEIEMLKKGEVIINDSGKRACLLDLMFRLSSLGSKMTDDELRQEVNTFTAAGSDTSANALCFFLLMLALHDEIQQKVYEEIIYFVGKDRDVTSEDLPHLKLTERCMKETLRLFPVAPVYTRINESDIDIGEYNIPSGCTLLINSYRLHRNEKYWKEPLKFDPDRFLPEEIKKRHPYSYLPFSAGPRGCIGYKYAMMSMMSIVATILRKFVCKTSYKSVEEVQVKMNISLKPVKDFNVFLQLRKDNL